jgi:formylglycine-generating enzyme required for sulfatase activity
MSAVSSASPGLRHLRVFLASPGDVADERALALRVLEQLQYDPLLRGRITVETVAWDKPGAGTPMLATLTPQEAIKQGLPTPAECDIVIVVFWARMGTPLPDEWKKPDGGRYRSGTEWEYLNALEAAEKYEKPAVLVYRRTEKINLDPDDPDFDLKSQQWRRVKEFFQSFTNPDGSLRGGYNPYLAPEEFREQLNLHLRSLVREILERAAPVVAVQPSPPVPPAAAIQPTSSAPPVAGPPLWPGSPFPGLRAFTPEDAPIFFGRGRETDDLVSRLDQPARRFLAVVGASGSGKSSLVAAGLIPRLMAGAIPGSRDWVWVKFTPGEVGDNPFMALAVAFKDTLQQPGRPPRELADKLEKDPATLIELRDLALADRPDWAELLLFVDQFEELFALVAPRYVRPFVEWLERAARTERLRVAATLRADFYHHCVEQAPLAALLRDGSYPLAAPGIGTLHEMIERPAERAGLTFEPELVERILDDTGTEPGRLALLAFALAELYAARTADGHLTQAAYAGFNGVQGAIAKRAEDTLTGLSVPPPTLGEVFQELVEIEEGGAVTRRRAPWVRLDKSADANRLVEAFVAARLLVASRGEGEDGQPVVEVAHEALFTAWTTLRDWIDAHRKRLEAGQDLEEAAQEWQAIGRRWAGLASGARLKRYRQAIKPSVLADRFLRASRRRLWTLRGTASAIVLLVLFVVGWAVWIETRGWTLQQGRSLVLAKLGFYHEPKMVEIEAGSFLMGSRDDDPQARDDEKPQRPVQIARFAIGKYEVTFREYDQFALDTGRDLPNDATWGRGQRPVINVSWHDAVAYAVWLSEKTGKQYRLPTEAEWEYACKAGKETTYCFEGDQGQIADHAWYRENSLEKTHPVGKMAPNWWGLHDMSGNVWEWTCSAYEWKYRGTELRCVSDLNSIGPWVMRGGSWIDEPLRLRSAARSGIGLRYWILSVGFRLAMTP